MRVVGDGEILWNYCSAHVGRNIMTNPYAHADGTFSCVLFAKDEGSEWIRLDENGKLLARIETPGAGDLCPHGAGAKAQSGIPYEMDGEPLLALICEHGDGTYCCAQMTRDGEIAQGAPFAYGSDWVVRPLPDGSGRIAFVQSVSGDAQVLFVTPGSVEAPHVADVPIEYGELEWVLDAVAARDGSVIFSGQLAKPAGVIARVSAEGGVLFCAETDDNAMLLAMTQEGFAAAMSSDLLFFDEDGALTGETHVDELYLYEEMIPADSGVTMLANDAGAKARQIRLTSVAQSEEGLRIDAENIIFAQQRAALEMAKAGKDGVHLLIRHEDGSHETVLIDTQGGAGQSGETLLAPEPGRLRLERGIIQTEAVFGGALVSYLSDAGESLWQTKTMIHTAADTLQWRCAAEMADGSILLGGRYLTGSGGGAAQQAVIARFGADGVLREMQAADGLGCICAILPDGEDALLLAARGKWATNEAQTLLRLSALGDPTERIRLDLSVAQENACLIEGTDGALYAAGTHQKNGAQAAVLLRAK